MIDVWLALPGWMLVSVLALFYAATGSAVWWVSFGRPLRDWAQGFKGVVAPFFGAVSVLFALQAGFLANDVVVRNREAVAAVNGEADAIREVFALSVASASDMTVIHRALVEYLQRRAGRRMARNGRRESFGAHRNGVGGIAASRQRPGDCA